MSGGVIKHRVLPYGFGGPIYEGACTQRGVVSEFYGMYVFMMKVHDYWEGVNNVTEW